MSSSSSSTTPAWIPRLASALLRVELKQLPLLFRATSPLKPIHPNFQTISTILKLPICHFQFDLIFSMSSTEKSSQPILGKLHSGEGFRSLTIYLFIFLGGRFSERYIAMEEKEDERDGVFHINSNMGIDGSLPIQLHHHRLLGGHGGCYFIVHMGQHVQTSWKVRAFRFINLFIHELLFFFIA